MPCKWRLTWRHKQLTGREMASCLLLLLAQGYGSGVAAAQRWRGGGAAGPCSSSDIDAAQMRRGSRLVPLVLDGLLLFVERLLLAGGAEGREGRRWLLGGVLVGAARCWHARKGGKGTSGFAWRTRGRRRWSCGRRSGARVQALSILAAVGVGCLIAGEREEGWVHLAFCGCWGKITKRRREGHVRREGDRKS